MPFRRMPPYATWMIYAATWSLVGALSWTTAAVYLVREVGMTPFQLVLTGTALEVAYFLFEIPTGVVADLSSRRLSLVIAAIVSGTAMIMIGAVPTVLAVLVGSALWGAGWTFRSGAEDAWLADEIGPERLGPVYQRAAQVERVAGLLGIGAAVGLALVDLQLPLIVAGSITLALGGFIAVAMPERGFTKPARTGHGGHVREALATVRTGTRLVRSGPVLVLVLGIAFVVGMWAEGFDRLWEAHLLLDVGLPPLGDLGDVAWFGITGAGTLVLSFAVAAPLVSRVGRLDQAGLARFLLVMHAVLMITAVAFALSGSFWLALGTYWATTVARELAGAPYRAWLNGTITDSSVRATVLSIAGVTGSAGEWVGGPLLGAVGTRWSVRTALATGALLLAPALVLFARAVRQHGRETELAELAEPAQPAQPELTR